MKLDKINFTRKKYSKHLLGVLFVLMALVVLEGCRLRDDFNKIIVKVPTQTIAIPMINSRLTIDDLLAINAESSEEYLNIDADSFITIVYAMDVEMPAVAGLDEIEIEDVNIEDAVAMDALPPIDDVALPGDTVTFRSLVGDQNADLIKILQAGDDIDTTICIDTAGTLDTTVCLDTSVTFDTTICVDTSVEFPPTSGIFIDTTICQDTSITFDTTVCADTSIPFDTTLCVDTVIEIEQQTIFPYPDTLIENQPAQEIPFDLQGFSRVTMESGILTMIIVNDFPFALTSVRFDMTNKDGPSIGTFTFPTDIEPFTTDSQQIDLAGQILTDTILFQMVSLGTVGDSGEIDVDAAQMAISVNARNMEIAGATGLLPTDTLAYDSMKTEISLPDSQMQISRAQLGSGSFVYDFVSKFATDMTIELYIPALSDPNGEVFRENILLDYQGEDSTVASKTIDLLNYNLDLSLDGIDVFYFAYLTNPDEEVTLTTSDEFSFSVDLTGIQVNYAEGYFGQMDLPSINDTMNLGLYNSQYSGTIRFDKPSIGINFSNSFGLPIDLDFSLMGYNNISGDSVPVIVNGEVGYPTTAGQIVQSTVSINETNNLDDFFALAPNDVLLSMDVVTNPDNDQSILNFITDSSAISVDVEMEIPLEGSIKSLVLMDTMSFTAAEDLQSSTNAVFHVNTINDFPASLGLQIYFADDNHNILDSLINPYGHLFQSATVGDDGRVIDETENYQAIAFNQERLDNIKNSTNLIIKGTIVTADDGNKSVKFYSFQGFNVQLGIQVDVSLDLIESLL